MSARDAIFAAVRAAVGPMADPATIAADAATLAAHPDEIRPMLQAGALVDIFIAAVARLPPGASVERVVRFEDIPTAAAAYMHALSLPPSLKVQPVAGLASLDWQGAGLAPSEDVDDRTAISLADAGIAETASIVVRSGADMPILDAFLPLHHIAVVQVDRIVAHIEDYWTLHDGSMPRNVILITGASGTTDIEGSLVIGVHGPGTVHIILVDRPSAPAGGLS